MTLHNTQTAEARTLYNVWVEAFPSSLRPKFPAWDGLSYDAQEAWRSLVQYQADLPRECVNCEFRENIVEELQEANAELDAEVAELQDRVKALEADLSKGAA